MSKKKVNLVVQDCSKNVTKACSKLLRKQLIELIVSETKTIVFCEKAAAFFNPTSGKCYITRPKAAWPKKSLSKDERAPSRYLIFKTMFNTEALEIRLARDIVPRAPRKETTVKRVVSERASSLALKKQQSSLEPGQYVSDEDVVD